MVFTGRYQSLNVIIKILSLTGIKNKEWEIQSYAAKNNLAPQILLYQKVQSNDIIIMPYLLDNWLSYNNVTPSKIREYKIDINTIRENICSKAESLRELKIDHRSLKDDNILVNYETNDIMFIDFEEAIIATTENEIFTMNKNYDEFIQNKCPKHQLMKSKHNKYI